MGLEPTRSSRAGERQRQRCGPNPTTAGLDGPDRSPYEKILDCAVDQRQMAASYFLHEG